MSEALAIGVSDLESLVKHTKLNSSTSFYDFELVFFDASEFVFYEFKSQGRLSTVKVNSLITILRNKNKYIKEYIETGGIVIYYPHQSITYEAYDQNGRNVSKILYDQMFSEVSIEDSVGKKFDIVNCKVKAIKEFNNNYCEILNYRVSYSELPNAETCMFVKGTKKAVSSYSLNEKGGGIIFSPAPKINQYDKRDKYFDGIKKLILDLRKKEVENFTLPEWHSNYFLPGEVNAIKEIVEIKKDIAEIQNSLENAYKNKIEIEELKILIFGSGVALEKIVKKVFDKMGLTLQEGEKGRDDLIGTYNELDIVIEIKGREKKGASESDAAQLEKWASNHRLENQVPPKAILIVNGYAELPLEERLEPVFPHQMLKYCEAREHCLISGLQLLCTYLEYLNNEDRKTEIIDKLVSTIGIYPEYLKDEWKKIITLNSV